MSMNDAPVSDSGVGGLPIKGFDTRPHGLPYQFAHEYCKTVAPDGHTKVVRVALYTRVSTPSQMIGEFSPMKKQQFGLEQTVALRANLGWRITHDFSDGARSGRNRKRKKAKEAHMAALAHEYDVLLVGAQARLARDIIYSLQFIEDLDRMGIEIWTVDGRRISAKGDAFVTTGITAVMDQHESMQLSTRILTANARRAARGLFQGGKALTGYMYAPDVHGQIMIGPGNDHAFELYTRVADGETVAEVENRFNDLGIVRPCVVVCRGLPNERTEGGKPYTRAMLTAMIRNVTYMGCVPCPKWKDYAQSLPPPLFFLKGVAIYKAAFPAIVTDETWRKANENLDGKPKLTRKQKTADLEGHFLSQGIVVCECGCPLYTKYVGKADDPKRRKYLVCRSQGSSNGRPTSPCGMPNIPSAAVDGCLVYYLSSLFKHPELLSMGQGEIPPPVEKNLGELQTELDSVRVQINDCCELFSEVKLTARESLGAQLRALSQKEAELLRRIRVYGAPPVTAITLDEVTREELQQAARDLDAAPPCELKKLVKIWVSKVEVKHVAEAGGHLRRFEITLHLKFKSLENTPAHVFVMERVAPHKGQYHIVAPFVQEVVPAPEHGVFQDSPCHPLVLLEKWKQEMAHTGISQKAIAAREGVSPGYVSEVIGMARIPRSLRDRLVRANHPRTGYNWLKRLASCRIDEMDWEVTRLLEGPKPRRKRRQAGAGDSNDSNPEGMSAAHTEKVAG